MLKNTFCHIPGIGHEKERKIWKSGVLTWNDYFSRAGSVSVPLPHRSIAKYLKKSEEALLSEDASFFADCLPEKDLWRIYPEFFQRALFLDIETTGLTLGADHITIIGTYDGKQMKTFVKGKNLADFPNELSKYSIVVTYNGKCFDIPFIKRAFKKLELPPGVNPVV